MNAPSASIIPQGERKESNVAVDVKVDSTELENNLEWQKT